MRVTAYIRQKDTSKNDLDSRASVYFRVRDKGLDVKCASELQILSLIHISEPTRH